MERYYFWEDQGEPFGIRCMGDLTGYPTKEALLTDYTMDMHIARNRKAGIPCWVLKATVDEVLVEVPDRSRKANL